MAFGVLFIHEMQNDLEFRKGPVVKGQWTFKAMRLMVSTLGPQSQDNGQEGSTCVCLCCETAGRWEKNGALETEMKPREVIESQGEAAGRGEASESL